jgi:hypothetical protein
MVSHRVINFDWSTFVLDKSFKNGNNPVICHGTKIEVERLGITRGIREPTHGATAQLMRGRI